MNPILVATLLLSASMAVMAGPGLRVAPRIDIYQPDEGYHSNHTIASGSSMESDLAVCGPGRVVQWQVEGCSGEGTCRVSGDEEKRQTEFEFIPSEDIDSLGIRINLIRDNSAQTVYDRAISGSSVQGGETYITNAVGGAARELKGETITIQYILYRVDSDDVEVCGEADFQIV